MAEVFRDMREHNKKRKEKNLAKASFTRHTDYHYSTYLQDKRLDYWPSANKWIWNGKKYHGDMQGFIRNRS